MNPRGVNTRVAWLVLVAMTAMGSVSPADDTTDDRVLALGALMGVVGQLGDLGKSVLKRDLGIKDFGTLFGPHGGVLDRFDAILVCMPLVYWYFWFLWMGRG